MSAPISSPITLPAPRLEDFIRAIFRQAGSSGREAELTARHLVEANLCGHDSHGVGVVPSYIRNAREGHLKLNQELGIVLDAGALLVCDGRQGMGQVMAHDAVALGIARAKAQGSCILALRDSFHIGRIGHWAEQCLRDDLVSLHFVNVISDAAVAPFGGTRARLGTNPFTVGIPRVGKPPILVDFATSRLAVGKMRVAMNKGETVPPGTLLDAEGRPTTDPAAMFADPPGALLTFGEHKGWGLALACELLAAALTGATAHAGGVHQGGIINSMLAIIVSPDRMGTAAPFAQSIEDTVAWVQSERDADGNSPVRLPGEPEQEKRARLAREGIAIDGTTWAELVATAGLVGLATEAVPSAA